MCVQWPGARMLEHRATTESEEEALPTGSEGCYLCEKSDDVVRVLRIFTGGMDWV